jgi:non-canonical (house-cleaning) NTP pyrophosphatase
LKIAIASTRKPKVDAVLAAAQAICRLGVPGWSAFDLVSRDVHSGVAATPTSDQELMAGAQNRALELAAGLDKEGIRAALYIGLEGGLHVHDLNPGRIVLLRGWAYVTDAKGGEGSFGSSPSIQVPAEIARAVLDRGLDLGNVIDEFSGRCDVRSNEGTWGILTSDLITRRQSFEIALVAALAPFYNRGLYGQSL